MANLDDTEKAAQLFNRCWDLLGKTRSQDEDVELLTASFSSRYHWLSSGDTEKQIIGDWMVARAAAAIGYGDLALLFAQRANRVAQESEIPDWLTASTAEGVARAYSVVGDIEEFNHWAALATRLISVIADPEDKNLIASQLAEINGP